LEGPVFPFLDWTIAGRELDSEITGSEVLSETMEDKGLERRKKFLLMASMGFGTPKPAP
jgi:hypothetical protein